MDGTHCTYLSGGNIDCNVMSLIILLHMPPISSRFACHITGNLDIELIIALGSRIKWIILMSVCSMIQGFMFSIWSLIVFMTIKLESKHLSLNKFFGWSGANSGIANSRIANSRIVNSRMSNSRIVNSRIANSRIDHSRSDVM
jgi:hypothetical protein